MQCIRVLECSEGGGELQDLLTCGDCLEEFPLSDIVRFIRHKVCHGDGRCSTSSRPADDEEGGCETQRRACAAADECPGDGADERRLQASPSRRLVCDSSLPGDDGPAADNRLSRDVDDCCNDMSTSAGQSTRLLVI